MNKQKSSSGSEGQAEKETNSDMSHILCIIDGMTDAGFRVEDYPHLSTMRLARYVDTTCGQPPESFGCILRLLGVSQIPAHLRGYAEALGYGIAVGSDDLVVRGSWFARDEQGRCTVPTDAPQTLPESEAYRYAPLGEYKSIFVFPGLAPCVEELTTCPPYACAALPAERMRPTGCPPLERVFDALKQKDRCMIPWGEAVAAQLPPVPQKGAVVCGAAIVKGIARLLGWELVPVAGATGEVDTDLEGKVQAALEAAKTQPFVLLHINGADEAAHRKDPAEKKAFLQRVDAVVLRALLRSGQEISVVADHGTDPSTGAHLPEQQPLFMAPGKAFAV